MAIFGETAINSLNMRIEVDKIALKIVFPLQKFLFSSFFLLEKAAFFAKCSNKNVKNGKMSLTENGKNVIQIQWKKNCQNLTKTKLKMD